MEKEITVIKVEEKPLSREEQKLLFQKISKDLDIPYFHFQNFLRGEDLLLDKKAKSFIQTSPSLLLRSLFNWDCVIPILLTFSTPLLKEGGVFREIKPKISLPKKVIESEKFHVFMSPAKDQLVIYEKDLPKFESEKYQVLYKISKNESVDIIGLLIDRIQTFYLVKVNVASLLKTGHYGDEYLQNLIFGIYSLTTSINIFNSEEQMMSFSTNLFRNLLYLFEPRGEYISRFLFHAYQNPTKINKELRIDIQSIFNIISSYWEKEQFETIEFLEELVDIPNLKEYVYLIPSLETTEIRRFEQSIWMEMNSLHLLTWFECFIYGIPNNDMNLLIHSLFYRAIEIIIDEKIVEHNFLEGWYRWIYEKKFNKEITSSLKDFIKGSVKTKMIEYSLRKLISEEEWKIVEIEFQQEQLYFKEMKKMPWVNLVIYLRNIGVHTEKITNSKEWKELQKYLPPNYENIEDDWIRSDGYPIICPHIIHIILGEKKETIIEKYKLQLPLYDYYYCRICGEILYYEGLEEGIFSREDKKIISAEEEPMIKYIWKQVSYIVYSYIIFKEIKTNIYLNHFISNITESLFEIINTIDKVLHRSKTATIKMVNNKLKIFTNVYIYAFLMKLILDNPEMLHFSFQKGFKKIKYEELFDLVLDHIISSHNILLNEISLSEISLKIFTQKAYKNVQKIFRGISEPPKVDENFELLSSPIYTYISLIRNLARKKTSLENLEKIEEIKLPLRGYGLYLINSFNIFAEYLNSKLFLNSVFNVKIIHDKVDEIIVKFHPLYEQYFTRYEPVKELEKKHLEILKYYYAHNYMIMPFSQDIMFDVIKHIYHVNFQLLARFYGSGINEKTKKYFKEEKESSGFHRHKWDIFVYVKVQNYRGNSIYLYELDEIEIITADLIKEQSFKSEFLFIDRLCSICRYSLFNILELPNITELSEFNMVFESFFNYYTYRCPVPGKTPFHEFSDTDVCSRCGLIKGKKSLEYFEKYGKGFLSKKIKQWQRSFITVEKIPLIKPLDWSFNPNLITEFVDITYDLTKLNKKQYYNFISGLGLGEYYYFEDLLSQSIYDVSKTQKIARAERLHGYFSEIVELYSVFRNYRHFAVLDPTIKNIISKLEIDDINNIVNLPNIEDIYKEIGDFPKEFELMRNHPNADLFALEKLLLLIMIIYNSQKKLTRNLIKLFIENLLTVEEIISPVKETKSVMIEAEYKSDPFYAVSQDTDKEYDEAPNVSKYSFARVDYNGYNDDINT